MEKLQYLKFLGAFIKKQLPKRSSWLKLKRKSEI